MENIKDYIINNGIDERQLCDDIEEYQRLLKEQSLEMDTPENIKRRKKEIEELYPGIDLKELHIDRENGRVFDDTMIDSLALEYKKEIENNLLKAGISQNDIENIRSDIDELARLLAERDLGLFDAPAQRETFLESIAKDCALLEALSPNFDLFDINEACAGKSEELLKTDWMLDRSIKDFDPTLIAHQNTTFIESVIADISEQLNHIENNAEQIRTQNPEKFKEIEKRLDEVETRLGNLREETEQLRNRTRTIETRHERINEKTTITRDEEEFERVR